MSDLLKPVLSKIKDLIPCAPDDWAVKVGSMMERPIGAEAIRVQVRRAEEGNYSKKLVEILRHLTTIVNKFSKEIKELTA